MFDDILVKISKILVYYISLYNILAIFKEK